MEKIDLSVGTITLIVLCTQIVFLYLRTLNVRATAHDRMGMAIITGVGIGLAWMVGTTIGVSSMLAGEWMPIAAHIIGGTLGTYWGMKYDRKKTKKNTHNDKLHRIYPEAAVGDVVWYEPLLTHVRLEKSGVWLRVS